MTDEQKLLQLILDETGKVVEPDTPLESLKMDSLEFVNLILQVDNTFNSKISDLAMIRINKVSDFLTEALAARIV
jgi:acyl carrier protein